jgi:hypothetical protein
MNKHFSDLSDQQQKWIREIESIKKSDCANSYELKYIWITELKTKLKDSGLELSEIQSYL